MAESYDKLGLDQLRDDARRVLDKNFPDSQYASGNALVRIGRELASVASPAASALKDLGDGTVTGITGTHITAAAEAGNGFGCWMRPDKRLKACGQH